TLAAGSDDGSVALWDTSSQTVRRILNGSGGGVRAAAFGPGGTALAVSSEQGAVRLWDLTSGASSAVLTGPTAEVLGLALGPDGHTLAAPAADGAIALWDVASPERASVILGPTEGVNAVAFSPDSRFLAAAEGSATTGTGTVDLWMRDGDRWDVAHHEGPPIHSVFGAVHAIAFSPDGGTIASGSEDGPILLSKVPSGSSKAALTGNLNIVEAVTFSPNGRTLASG